MHALTVLAYLSLVALQEIGIFTRNIDTKQEQDIGVLTYGSQNATSAFQAYSDISFGKGHYSVCARDLETVPGCFGYQEGPGFGGDFQILVNGAGTIEGLSFVRGKVPLVFGSLVKSVESAPKPNLNPYNRQTAQSQAQTLKVVQKKVVENEAGEKVEVEEEIEQVVETDNRSWVQKNWMYIIPPLVLFLIFSPDEKKEENAPAS